MLEIIAFFGILGFMYWQGWYVVGMIMLIWVIFNGVAAAFMAVRDPHWYVRKRRQAIGEAEYTSFFGPDEETARRDIHNLLLSKIVTTIPLVALCVFFAMKAGMLG